MYASLVEVYKEPASVQYSLRQIWINPFHVVHFKEDLDLKRAMQEGLLPSDLNEEQTFTRVYVACGSQFFSASVVGNPVLVWEKLDGS